MLTPLDLHSFPTRRSSDLTRATRSSATWRNSSRWWIPRLKAVLLLMGKRDVLERYPPEYGRIPELLHRIQDLNSREMSLRIVIGGDPVREMLGRYRCLAKADVKSIHLLVVGDGHLGSFKNSTRKPSHPGIGYATVPQSGAATVLRQSPISRRLRAAL